VFDVIIDMSWDRAVAKIIVGLVIWIGMRMPVPHTGEPFDPLHMDFGLMTFQAPR